MRSALASLPIRSAREAAAELAPHFAAAEVERVALLLLDRERQQLGLVTHGGHCSEVELELKAMLTEALKLGAAGLIIAHNHPSGDPAPSAEDKAVTRRLSEACGALGLALHDHLIFAGGSCRSMRALGLL